MSEDTTAVESQADETENNPQPQAGNTPPEPQAGEGQNISLDEAKKLRSEAANLRKRLKAFEEADAKAKDAQLSEQERLQKQLADLQSQHDTATRTHQERIIGYEVRLQASQMGIVDPDAAAKLLDWSQIEYDDNGAPLNVSDLLKGLIKAKPYLAGSKPAPTSGGATNPPRSQSTAPKELSWQVISSMKPDEYNARRAEIQQWMLNNPSRFK